MDGDKLEKEISCGFGPYRPSWLQKFASKKSYVVVYGLIGTAQFALGSYFVATISTMEKRFKIPSQTSGLINSAWDIGSIFTSLLVAYLGRSGHKTRWVASGTALVAVSCYMRLIPHWLYGPGEEALSLTEEFGGYSNQSADSNISLSTGLICDGINTNENYCPNASSGNISALILFLAHVVLGIGTSVYYTLGISFMDDNTKKNKAPILLAIWQCLRMLGPTAGYFLAAIALEMYVEPELTPIINSKDPRWVGAWWYGWNPFGIIVLILALVMALFPRSLPRTAQRNIESGHNINTENNLSISDFMKTVKRLLKNKILVCNCISSTCFMFGLIGQWVFMPKYVETMFHQTASTASQISGSIGLLCTAAGVLVSAGVISKFKPSARKLAVWNVIVEIVDVLGFVIIAFIGCEALNLETTRDNNGSLNLNMECNENCGCVNSVEYAPVCDPTTNKTYFTACYAGCSVINVINSTTKHYSSCSCVSNGIVVDGACPVNCSQAFLFYILVQCIQRFFSATGRAGNTLIHFRCVKQEDKSVSLGLLEFLLCAFAFIPGPIIFGILIDLSCDFWGFVCGKSGNCLLYDVDKLRVYVNLPVIVFLFLGTMWDCGVCYYVKDLQLYDKKDSTEQKEHGNVIEDIQEENDEDETKKLNFHSAI